MLRGVTRAWRVPRAVAAGVAAVGVIAGLTLRREQRIHDGGLIVP
jgi:hypothetical protein